MAGPTDRRPRAVTTIRRANPRRDDEAVVAGSAALGCPETLRRIGSVRGVVSRSRSGIVEYTGHRPDWAGVRPHTTGLRRGAPYTAVGAPCCSFRACFGDPARSGARRTDGDRSTERCGRSQATSDREPDGARVRGVHHAAPKRNAWQPSRRVSPRLLPPKIQQSSAGGSTGSGPSTSPI